VDYLILGVSGHLGLHVGWYVDCFYFYSGVQDLIRYPFQRC
jgi:hypothetical protein